MFAWLGIWSAIYGVGRLSGSPAFMAAWHASSRDARLVNTVTTFLIIVPALLTFRQLVRGPLARFLLVACWAALVIGVAGIAMFLATGSSRVPYQLNNALAACVLVVLVISIAVPGLWAKYLVASDRRVLVAGTVGFAVEALYSNIGGPLGIGHWQLLDDVGFALLLLSLAYIALATVFTNERRLLAVENELEIARRIQRSILPRALPSTRGLRVAATYEPMTAVAGDFYEFLQDGDGRVGILVADAAGHGVPAALIASMIKVAIQAVASSADDPATVLAGMNRVLARQDPSPLVSAAYLWFDTGRRTLRYSSAGHPPIVRCTGDRLERIESNGFLLGMAEEAAYPVAELAIQPGERILIYTDGVTEVENARGEFFGERRLDDVVRDARTCTPDELSATLLSEISRWRPAAAPQQDDITFVIVDVV